MFFGIYLGKDKDGTYKAICPHLPGCIEKGRTREEALRKLRRSIFKYIRRAVENMFLELALANFLPPLELPFECSDQYYPENLESVFNIQMSVDPFDYPHQEIPHPEAEIAIGLVLSMN